MGPGSLPGVTCICYAEQVGLLAMLSLFRYTAMSNVCINLETAHDSALR